MIRILKYSFFDLARSRWTYAYFGFYLLLSLALLFLNNDLSKAVISLMNVVVVLCPLVAVLFGIMYSYNSREFVELLLAQPIRRTHIFFGQYLGLAVSLSLSLLLGLGIPFLFYGLFKSASIWNFVILLISGVALSFIFSGLAFLIALKNENRIRGFGLVIFLWLFLAVIYYGIFLGLLVAFKDYPLEKPSLVGIILNPIDLSRILILLKLDMSALMGFTGAVFRKFFGTGMGMVITSTALLLWTIIPLLAIRRAAVRKDF